MPQVYILKTSSGRYYIGSTTDIGRRMKQHLDKKHTHSTKRMGTLTLVFSQEYNTLTDAREVERRLKKLKRKDYIDKIIKEGSIRMKY